MGSDRPDHPPQRVLFVCTENANRSQMAHAFARMHGADVIQSASAGSAPAAAVNPRAIEAMRERGYDLADAVPQGLVDVVGGEPWDYLITMGCGDRCPAVPAAHREDWALPDPRDMPAEEFRAVRDEIERRVLDLIDRIKSERPSR